MNNTIDRPFEYTRHHLAIAHIASDGRHALACNLFDALDRFRRAVAEVIQTHDVVTAGKQLDHRVRADVARTSSNEHSLQDVMRTANTRPVLSSGSATQNRAGCAQVLRC